MLAFFFFFSFSHPPKQPPPLFNSMSADTFDIVEHKKQKGLFHPADIINMGYFEKCDIHV